MVQAVRLWHAVPAERDPIHEWKFSIASVKLLSRHQHNARSMFLYVHENSDDFHIIFPASEHREHCYERVMTMIRGDESTCRNDGSLIEPHIPNVRETLLFLYFLSSLEFAFCALTLLVGGRKGIQPVKN